MKNTPSTEERVWAVLSHLSAIAFGMGVLLPVIGWSEQRRKSKYASFQSLQALGYQSLGYTVWILLALVIVIVQSFFTLSELITAAESGADFERLTTMVMGGHFVVTLGLIGLYALLPIIAAVSCALGRDFRYPVMGHRLARYLGYDPLNSADWLIEDHEDRWVAGMGHFSVIIMLWGMLIPLLAWIMQGKRSVFLKFQSVQTLIYQAGTLLLYFAAMFLYLFSFLILFAGMEFTKGTNSSLGLISIIIFGLSLLIVFLIVLAVPLLHILGQWAGYRVLKGDDYHYPLVGRLVERWLGKQN